MITKTIVIGDPLGLHARTVAAIAGLAKGFASSVWISHHGQRASLAKPLAVLALNIPHGGKVTLIADGLDEQEVLTEVAAMLSKACN